jgi:hypothetical protein
MSIADMGLMASVLVVVAIVAKMLRAIRLLDGRVSLLQEQLKVSHSAIQKVTSGKPVAAKPAAARSTFAKTPVQGVPVVSAASAAPRTPAPVLVDDSASDNYHFPGEATAHVIDEAEAELVWAKMAAEQDRLKRAMGKDFQVRAPKRSATEIRGKPAARTLTAQELANKLERK